MLVNLDLLKMVSEEKKHTFISTGLSSMDDIEKAVKILEKIIAPLNLCIVFLHIQ